jgi:tRNA A58 N-methylase Trm61
VISVLSFAQQLVRSKVREGDTVVDATLGNGNDALFLAELVGPRGRVAGFDVQATAVEASRSRLMEAGVAERCALMLCGHERLAEVLATKGFGEVAAVMFNLGYLPGSDEAIITKVDSTLAALEQAVSALRRDGLVSIIVYPGHPGGSDEADAVESWAAGLATEAYQVMSYRPLNRLAAAPYGIFVCKR